MCSTTVLQPRPNHKKRLVKMDVETVDAKTNKNQLQRRQTFRFFWPDSDWNLIEHRLSPTQIDWSKKERKKAAAAAEVRGKKTLKCPRDIFSGFCFFPLWSLPCLALPCNPFTLELSSISVCLRLDSKASSFRRLWIFHFLSLIPRREG